MDLLDDRYTSICNLSFAYMYTTSTVHNILSNSNSRSDDPACARASRTDVSEPKHEPQGPGIMRRIYIGPAISMTSYYVRGRAPMHIILTYEKMKRTSMYSGDSVWWRRRTYDGWMVMMNDRCDGVPHISHYMYPA